MPRSLRAFVASWSMPIVVPALALSLTTSAPAGGDPWADTVSSYDAGIDPNPSYLDPDAAVGAPERYTGEGVFPGVVTPFNPPFNLGEIVSIGAGGSLVLAFDEPVRDDPGNPHGIDLLVFGNSFFIDSAFPDGIVGGVFVGGGTVEVSTDGVTWVVVTGAVADGFLPTLGYLDVGPYDVDPGAIVSDFTRPADPGLAITDLEGLGMPGIIAAYDGGGGGAGVDLATTGLAEVSFVRISNPAPRGSIEIDAVSDVRAAGDVNGDGITGFADLLAVLSSWGACPAAPPAPCPADVDRDGIVGFADLLLLLATWTTP